MHWDRWPLRRQEIRVGEAKIAWHGVATLTRGCSHRKYGVLKEIKIKEACTKGMPYQDHNLASIVSSKTLLFFSILMASHRSINIFPHHRASPPD